MNKDTRGWNQNRSSDPGPEDQKSYQRILEEEIEAGLLELRRPARGLLLSGLSAGLDIGFGVLVIAVILTLSRGELPELVVRLLEANAYAVGFVFVILGRSELFTEHTTLAAIPVFARRASPGRLLRLWGLVYVANLAGASIFALFAGFVLPELGSASAASFDELARRLVDHPWWIIFLSAILAGWLMGLLSWLVTAARDTIGKLFVVWVVTGVIGFAGLHHCIVGTVEVVAGLEWGWTVDLVDALRFLAMATLGNAVGGVFFVALIKYGHASQSSE